MDGSAMRYIYNWFLHVHGVIKPPLWHCVESNEEHFIKIILSFYTYVSISYVNWLAGSFNF